MTRETGVEVAHHLGRALQLTNIIRDLDEDAAIGRLYLPEEALAAAGITTRDPVAVIADPRVDTVCRALALEAQQHFDAARAIMRDRPSGRQRTPRLMAEVYAHLLGRMAQQGWVAPRTRAKISKRYLLWLVVRYGLVG
jgi:phytoene synthase